MKGKLSFGPLQEKMEDVIVEGQAGCLEDCYRYTYWKGAYSSNTKGCKQKKYYDAHWSTKR